MPKMKVENFSPLDPIHSILSGPPGTEAAMCLTLPPEKSLFEPNTADANVVRARADHDRMRSEFQNRGIKSFNMRRIIGQELAKKNILAFNSRHAFLEELIKRTYHLHQRYNLVVDFDRLVLNITELFDLDIKTMGLDSAIAINGVLTNVLDGQGKIKSFNSNLPPAGNFLFWRDTNHITGNQMATHKMFYPIRDQEVILAKIGFDALGLKYKDVITNKKDGSIEGGDILPVELGRELFSLIGTAERTSRDAIFAWFKLHEKLFSASGEGIIPMVVKGPKSDTQDQMHLDTFAQQIAPGAIIHCGKITKNRSVWVIMRKKGKIILVKPENLENNTLKHWFEQKATNIHDMTTQEQLMYAPNVLVDGSKSKETTVYITRQGTPNVTRFIRQHAVKTILLEMDELTKFYGGAHCATSEIRYRP